MISVRISATIANEYLTRDVYDDVAPWGFRGGTVETTEERARELLADAKYFVFDTDGTPGGIVRAYAALMRQLLAKLGE